MKKLVMVGAGHAHALVLLAFAKKLPQSTQITLISPTILAPYSGMVPGWLAGYYNWEECCVNFSRLCEKAGVRLLIDSVSSIDVARMKLVLASGNTLSYDWLSLNVGSTVMPPSSGQQILPTRPLSDLQPRWDNLLHTLANLSVKSHHQFVVVGGGVSAVEVVLAARHALARLANHVSFRFTLVTEEQSLLPNIASGAAWRLRAQLDAHDIEVVTGFKAVSVSETEIFSDDQRALQADTVLWATGAQPHPWLRQSGLQLDASDFVAIDKMLRSPSHANVFAAGDCAGWHSPLPKAGVFSVRMGPILAHNLRAAMEGGTLLPYVPQRRHLALIGTGDEHAVAAWGNFSWQGKWIWRLKQSIDRRFLASCERQS